MIGGIDMGLVEKYLEIEKAHEDVYDQLSVGDTVEVYKKVTYLFGAYFGTDYKLKN